jgi:methionyl aminopeptidase
MTIEDAEDLFGLQRAGRAVADARDAMLAAMHAGMSTAALDAIGRETLTAHGARSAPQLAYDFPGTTCISVNNEAAHGIPSAAKLLADGDLVNIDVSAELDGYWADTGASAAVGPVSPTARRLLDATKLAQRDGMDAARAGRPRREIGRAIERRAKQHGFTIIENLCGHGVGRFIHEDPQIPSVEQRRDRMVLHEGLVLAIEPFLSTGARFAVDGDDGWTLYTSDGGLSAQFEHTVVVMQGRPQVLTLAAAG